MDEGTFLYGTNVSEARVVLNSVYRTYLDAITIASGTKAESCACDEIAQLNAQAVIC